MFFNGKKSYFLIFLVIALVVSITPASAALVYHSSDNHVSKSSELDNAIDQDINKIQSSINVINRDLDYVKTRSKDYDWRFWKWPAITSDILGAFYQMSSTSVNMKGTIDNLNKNIETSKNTPDNSNDVYNTNATADANDMATVLSKHLNTKVNVEKVDANDIKEGDIIQYISQDKYPRYFEVKNIIQDNAKKVRTDENVPLIFAGIYTTIFSIHNNDYLRLNLNGADPETTVKTGIKIQNETLTKALQKADELNKKGNKDKKSGKNCLSAALAIGGLAAIVAISGTCSVVALEPAMIITGVLGFITLVLAIPGGKLYTQGENENKKAMDLATKVQLCLADLNHVASNEKQTTTMDVSTSNGIPIVKKPPNYKKYIGYLTKKPEHGTVLIGPGIQFLYGPIEGYTGTDTFTIQYIDNEELKTLEIHITIQEIPTLTTPKEV